MLGKVALLEKIINYHFDAAHVLLAIEALETTTIPYRYTNSKREMRTNQVLAIYGDVVSAAQLCEFWINNRPAHGRERITFSPKVYAPEANQQQYQDWSRETGPLYKCNSSEIKTWHASVKTQDSVLA